MGGHQHRCAMMLPAQIDAMSTFNCIVFSLLAIGTMAVWVVFLIRLAFKFSA